MAYTISLFVVPFAIELIRAISSPDYVDVDDIPTAILTAIMHTLTIDVALMFTWAILYGLGF